MPGGICKRCGEPTGNPDGRQWYCEPCRVDRIRECKRNDARAKAVETRRPCARCGGDKGPGERRWYCATCEPLAREAYRAAATERARQWNRANAERARFYFDRNARARRAAKQRAPCEPIEGLVVLERDDGRCGICGGDVDPLEFHLDHIQPLSGGGSHTYDNVQPAHPRCNLRKGASVDVALIAA